MQVMSAISAMQTAGHDKSHGTSSIVPALAKSARAGHPEFRNGKGEGETKGWGTRPAPPIFPGREPGASGLWSLRLFVGLVIGSNQLIGEHGQNINLASN